MRFNYLAYLFIITFFLACSNSGKYPIIDPLKDTAHSTSSTHDSTTTTTTLSTINPASLKNIYETISLSADHTLFIAAIQSAGLEKVLSGNSQYTLLAPTDEAFKKLPRSVYNNILKPSNHDKTKELISAHILVGKINESDMKDGTSLKTLNGHSLPVVNKDGTISIKGVTIRSSANSCKNGSIIITDMVIQ